MSSRITVLAAATFALAGPAAADPWGCGCTPARTVVAAPFVAAAPIVVAPVEYVLDPSDVVSRPIYVVNQGPVHAGPGIVVVPSLRIEGPIQPYPYVGTYRGWDRYAVRRPYDYRPHYRPYGTHYRPYGAYRRDVPLVVELVELSVAG